ncbi:VWA domain-containing protein [Catellatospora sp. KI3]|uniref:VWA domain-containing protein n=1 Tax=Catellatospora sp. KI3 TaxID=3041620 RepID=UPI0024825A7B|nr:VWA domain-containing protein [Catellatospora sp. KI3]MDI1466063.1 VWA domain-containing protein [Catellatospora sp. KI3]
MALTWPWALAALLAVPLLLLARWLLQRRRRRSAVRVSSLALIRAAVPGPSAWRRRIPVWLFLAALAALGVGVARPHASMLVPTSSTSIVLAIDVSQSMCSTDVPPNRMVAARAAAREFVLAQDDGTRIGLVAFSGISGLLVEPTTDKQVLLDAIDTLRTARGTAIGQAILTAIDAIAESNPDVLPTGVELPDPGDVAGQYAPDTIVVLTDGANTQGVTPEIAAEQAKARRIRIYTIGFGTTDPAPIVCSVDQIDQGTIIRPPDGRFGGGGGRRAQLIDEETLTAVADSTGGEYFRAEDAEQLGKVLGDLPSTIVAQRRDVELTVWFVLAAALLAFAAVGLSLRWNRG